MGGVLVFWSQNKEIVNDQIFDDFVDSLTHRGPDARTTFYDPTTNLRLGNRELKVFDLAAKAKMNFFGKRYWITYNGRIYNFIELREELQKKGYHFETEGDVEVVVASFIEWGKDCLYKFNGMWAFAIWDDQEKLLFVSRDRFGVKPLHYFFDGQSLAMASELKSFMKLPLPVQFDAEMLKLSIAYQCHLRPNNQTLLKDVYELKAGHYCIFNPKEKSFKINQWWNTLDHLHDVPKKEVEIIEEFKRLFLDAVKIRMRANTSVGCLLSGGVDSSSVFCAMNYLFKHSLLPEYNTPSWNNAFIASYPRTTFDETYYAMKIAETTQAQVFNLDVYPEKAVNEFEQIIYYNEELFEFPIGPWMLYKLMKENGFKICLDGEAGDDIFVGFHNQVLSLRNSFRRFHPFKYLDLNKIYIEMHEHVAAPTQTFKSKFKDFLSKPVPQKFYSKSLDPINSNVYEAFLKNVHFGMRNWDRLAMSQGIENRAPIRDWRLTCFVFSLAGKWKVGGGFTKTLFRKAMHNIVPDEVRLKKGKLGFANPNSQWGEQGWYQYFLDRVNSQHFLECPLWDGKKIKKDVDDAYTKKKLGEIPIIAMGYVVADFLVQSFEKVRIRPVSVD